MDKGTLEIDLSIVEIVEESDVLLLQSFKDDSKDQDLSISSLKFPRSGASAPSISNNVHRQISHPDILKHAKGQKPHCLPCEDDQNKENFDMVSEKNLGMPTFPKELAPRRKRKAGGCNLRKSLAWNRAFLTEEGILNHEELSILSGAFSDSSKTLLSGINEGETSYVLHSSLSDQSDLQVPEENLFRGLPASSLNRDQKLGSISSMSESSTQEDPLASRCLKCPLQASRKVNLAKGNNRSVAQGGCFPQLPASYSQKRLTNVNTTNASSKIPKLSTCKIDTPLLRLPPKDATLANNHLHCNQSSPPVYDEKNLKHSSVNAKKPVTCTAWSATSAKPCLGKYMVKQPSKMPITSLLQTPQVVRGTVDLKVDPEPIIPHAADIHAPTPAGLADPIKVEVSFPHHHSFNFGNISSRKYDSKPSGLRMPSPSLGYFSQARASAGHRFPLQKVSQLCSLSESSNPTPKKSDRLKHIGELRPPYAADQRLSKQSLSTTITITNAAVSLGTQNVSSLKGAISSPVNPCLTLKTNSKTKELQQVAVKDLPDSGSCNKSSSPEQLYGDCSGLSDIIEEQSGKQALNMPDLDGTRKISHQEEVTSQMSDGALIVESGCSERSQQPISFVNHSIDVSLSRDFGGTQLSSPHALPQQSIAKKVKAGVSGIYRDADINEPHVEANSLKAGPVDDEYYRASNVDLSAEKNNIDEGTYLEAESSLMSSQEQVTAAGIARSVKSDCSSEKLDPSLQATLQLNGSVSLVHDDGLMSDLLHEESQHALSGNCNQLNGHGNQLEIDTFPANDKMASRPAGIRRSLVDDSKKDFVPFSDEWLAACVAAGDDILTIKTGAVQNSPPDKSVQEPGPWSPVKRNVQDVGPFDCTKYTSHSTT